MAFSTQSRGLWASTSSVMFQAFALIGLVRPWRSRNPRPLRPWLLATFMAWSWFCRATMAVHLIAMGIFVLWRNRRAGLHLAVWGAMWLSAFVLWSHQMYHTWLPPYYSHAMWRTELWGAVLAANLFSPGRGFFIYAPVAVGVVALLVAFRRHLKDRALLGLCAVISLTHVAIVSAYWNWTSGHAFGARFCVELLPWLTLAAVIAIASAQAAVAEKAVTSGRWRVLAIGLAICALAGVAINAPSGFVHESFDWNLMPIDIGTDPLGAVWNWRYPQFLAGTIGWPEPDVLPEWLLDEAVQFGAPGDEKKYLLERWGGADPGQRWAYGPRARMAFSLRQPQALDWTIVAAPYCPHETCDQIYRLTWNGTMLETFHVNSPGGVQHRVTVPANVVAKDNIVAIEVLNPLVPHDINGAEDFRPLGLGVRKMLLVPHVAMAR